MRNRPILMTAAVAALLALPAVAAAGNAEEGGKTFRQMCANCHGPTGKGDGPTGGALNPKPKDLSDPAWQDSVSDERIVAVTQKGGAANGLSPMMPPFGHIQGEKMDDIVAFIRSLKGK